MANLKDSPKFKIHNDYYTPKCAWEKINKLIPKDKVVWEACMLNSNLSKSPQYLTELGNEVVYDTSWDILKENHGDIIITNPPFETKIKIAILKRLVELDKPSIIIMNSMNTFANYFKPNFFLKSLMFSLREVVSPHKIHRLNEAAVSGTFQFSFFLCLNK